MKKKSKLEPHVPLISKLLSEGHNYAYIQEILYEKYELEVSESWISAFCKSRHLENKIQSGRHNNPICDECDKCLKFVKAKGIGELRVCADANRQIEYLVKTSPEWCKKRFEKGG